LRDLFVNGTSIASGWGTGYEQRVPQPNQTSWVHYFANTHNVQKLWNHSAVSKPIQISIEDTVGFCSEYLDHYGSYNNLFVIVELLLPENTKWPSIHSPYSDEVIQPIVIQTPDGKLSTMFVRHSKQKNYLSDKNMLEYVHPSQIDLVEYQKHALRLQNYSQRNKNLSASRLWQARSEIKFLHEYLLNRNIAHVIFWGCGMGHSYHKTVDRAIMPIVQQHRLIPMQTFTCFSKGSEWSQHPIEHHPDQQGHQRIAKFLNDYIAEHDLIRPPNQINKFYEHKRHG
jgi:hypothetical protein